MASKASTNARSVNRLNQLKTINGESLAGPGNITVSTASNHNTLGGRDSENAHPIESITGLQTALDDKVSIVAGKDLSTEDYTTEDKDKLDGIETNAQANTASNVGSSGVGLYKDKLGAELRFKKIVATGAASITEQDNTVTINVTGGGGGETPTSHNELTGRDASDAHPITAVTGLQAALNDKAASVHGHGISDVTGLQTALNDKANTLHGHSISDVTGLQTALNEKEALGTAATIQSNNTLLQTIRSKAIYIADFVKNQFKTYEAPYGQQPKQLTDVVTNTRASDATRNTPYGVETVGANIVRIEYDKDGKPVGALNEPTVTNLALDSFNMLGGAWISDRVTPSFHGTFLGRNFYKLIPTTELNTHVWRQTIVVTSGLTTTMSAYFKYEVGQYKSARIRIRTANNIAQVVFNLETGALTGQVGNVNSENLGSGIIKLTISGVTDAVNNSIQLLMNDDENNLTFSGDGVSGFITTGWMLNQNIAYPSSDIPTTSSAVTRITDAMRTQFSSRFLNDTFSFMVDVTPTGIGSDGTNRLISFSASDAAVSDQIGIDIDTSGTRLRYRSSAFTGVQSWTPANPATLTGRLRIVGTVNKATGSVKLWVNGTLVINSTTTNTANIAAFRFIKYGIAAVAGGNQGKQIYHDAWVFPSGLSDVESLALSVPVGV